MRRFTSAFLLGAALMIGGTAGNVVSSASAQSGYVHHNFCLLTGPARECAYETMQQCLSAKRGNADFCEPNGTPLNHAAGRYRYQ